MSANFLLLGFCFIVGFLFRIFKRLPPETPAVLNGYILNIALPATILLYFHEVFMSSAAIPLMAAAWLLFIFLVVGVYVIWTYVGRKQCIWNGKTIGALILTAGLGNTSFVGYPMLEALYGPKSIQTAVFVDQLGTFLVFSTLGIGVASFFSTRNVTPGKIMKRMIFFPPFWAMAVATMTGPFEYPALFKELLTKLAATLSPLALVSVGFQLKVERKAIRRHAPLLGIGLFYKLFLGPALVVILYRIFLKIQGQVFHITILEMAMAPMVSSAILAAEYSLDTELANLMVGIGIPLSFVTVPLWAYLLERLF